MPRNNGRILTSPCLSPEVRLFPSPIPWLLCWNYCNLSREKKFWILARGAAGKPAFWLILFQAEKAEAWFLPWKLFRNYVNWEKRTSVNLILLKKELSDG